MISEEAIKVLIKFKELNDKSQPLIVFDAIDFAIQAIQERDAAVADLKELNSCEYCKHYMKAPEEVPCQSCGILDDYNNWEWRGIDGNH